MPIASALPELALPELAAREAATDRSAEAMDAALLALGWTERRPGVFGVGAGLEEDDAEQPSTVDSSADVSQGAA